MSETDSIDNPQRRNFLGAVTSVVGAGGAAVACWPLIHSMNPSKDVLAGGTTEVDLTNIPVGGTHTVSWQGKPVFIVHRNQDEISKAKTMAAGLKQPEADEKRAPKPEWLIVIGICSHLGCVPNRNKEGWLCACHGSIYDDSGRIISGPAPTNLEVPPYKFVTDSKIVIG